MTFDKVLETLLEVCESWSHAQTLTQVAIVRDLRGRVRLVFDCKAELAELLALESVLKRELGDWFVPDLLTTESGATPLRNIARRLLSIAPPRDDLEYLDKIGQRRRVTPQRWRLLERRIGKLPWLESADAPPWSLRDNGPGSVAFYSFKGGVGRTTSLAACALLAAQAQEKVIVIDLDLEAPGAGSLFGVHNVERGVLDVLVDHLGTDQIDLQDALYRPEGVSDSYADFIQVMPAGNLRGDYLEKLARLDFSSTTVDLNTPQSPVRSALRALLEKLRADHPSHWILLDARAGLHDLAGLSLHGLAHIDVIFSRQNRQGVAGLELVLKALARREPEVTSKTVLVHALASANVDQASAERGLLQQETFELFRKYLYRGRIPEMMAEDAEHRPWTIRREESIERNDRLETIIPLLIGADYQALWERIKIIAEAGRSKES